MNGKMVSSPADKHQKMNLVAFRQGEGLLVGHVFWMHVIHADCSEIQSVGTPCEIDVGKRNVWRLGSKSPHKSSVFVPIGQRRIANIDRPRSPRYRDKWRIF